MMARLRAVDGVTRVVALASPSQDRTSGPVRRRRGGRFALRPASRRRASPPSCSSRAPRRLRDLAQRGARRCRAGPVGRRRREKQDDAAGKRRPRRPRRPSARRPPSPPRPLTGAPRDPHTKILIPVVALVVAAAAFWFLALAPKREEIAKLDTDIAAQQAEVEQSQQLVASYEKAKANYRANYTKVARLGKAVPADDDVRSLLVQLDDAATPLEGRLPRRSTSAAAAAPRRAAPPARPRAPRAQAPPPGTVPVGSAGFSAMPFSFVVQGQLLQPVRTSSRGSSDFVTVENDKIDVTGRLLLLGSISVTPQPGADGRATSCRPRSAPRPYLVPPTEGVAGAATPAGPGGRRRRARAERRPPLPRPPRRSLESDEPCHATSGASWSSGASGRWRSS